MCHFGFDYSCCCWLTKSLMCSGNKIKLNIWAAFYKLSKSSEMIFIKGNDVLTKQNKTKQNKTIQN